jgi:hypothetical protein
MHHHSTRLLLGLCGAFAFTVALNAQTSSATPPGVASLLGRVLQTLSAGSTFNGVVINGTATVTAGSRVETGTVKMTASNSATSSIEVRLGGGVRVETRTDPATGSAGTWSDSDRGLNEIALHNGWTEPVWFFPALCIVKVGQSDVVFDYIGEEQTEAGTLAHFSYIRKIAGRKGEDLLAGKLSRTELYLDRSTLLPAKLAFATHPDNDANIDISIEIRFSEYQRVNGVLVPFHIEKFLNNLRVLDVRVTDVEFN